MVFEVMQLDDITNEISINRRDQNQSPGILQHEVVQMKNQQRHLRKNDQ